MYYILNQIMNPNQIAMIGVLVAFILTFLGLKFPFSFLPVDHGREFAVNGALSKGKTRGVGLTFVCSFIISCVLFMPMDKEYIIYCILLFAMMLSAVRKGNHSTGICGRRTECAHITPAES